MKYIFYTKSNFIELRSWDGIITNVPSTYRWLLGKPVETAITWFKAIQHKMEVRTDDDPGVKGKEGADRRS